MAFPTNLDDNTTIPVESASTPLSTNHVANHTAMRTAIIAVETLLGIVGSAVTGTFNYILSEITGADKAVGKSATQDLTNKNLGAGTKITLGSDATGDICYRHSDGTLKRLAVSTDGKILKLASGVPAWDTETVTSDASTTVKGIVEEATLAEIDANTAAGGTSARLFVNPSTLGKSIDGTMADNSDAKIPSQKAVKTYVDNNVGSYVGAVTSLGNSSASGYTDTTYTLPFSAKAITLYYWLQGYKSSTIVYTVGTATFDGTTLIGNMTFLKNAASANFTPATTTIDNSAVTAGTTGAGVDEQVTITIQSISATQLVIRTTWTRGSAGNFVAKYYPVVTR